MNLDAQLKLAGLSADARKKLLSEDVTEKEAKDIWQSFLENEREVAATKAKKNFEEEEGGRIAAKIYGSTKQSLKKLGLFEPDEIEEGEVKDLIKSIPDKIEAKVTEAAQTGDETLKTQVNEWKEKYSSLKQEIETKDEQIEKVRKEAQGEIRNYKETSLLEKAFSGVTWDDTAKADIYKKFTTEWIKENYSIDPEKGTLLDKDGKTNALTPDGDGIWKKPEEAIKYYAEKHNLVKRSNGGETEPKSPVGQVVKKTKDYSDVMSKRAEELQRLNKME